MNLRASLIAFFVAFSLLASAAPAFADVLPPNTEGCDDGAAEAVGKSCMTDDGEDGTCLAETCNGLDYTNKNDAGEPGTKTFACAICYPPDGGASTDGGDAGLTHVTGGGGGASDGTSSGGCNLGGADASMGAVFLGLLVPALARRRKTRKTH